MCYCNKIVFSIANGMSLSHADYGQWDELVKSRLTEVNRFVALNLK